jgi:hypothetical protein
VKAIAAGSAGAVYDPLPESKAKHDVMRAIFAGAIDIGSRSAISSHGSVNMVAGADEGGTGSQIVTITAAMRVLGRDGRVMDRLAVRSGDILLRHGDTVLDELASTATICGPLAQAEGAQQPMILNVATLLPNGADLGTSKLHRRSDVVVVLLLPSTRLKLPPGQAFAGLKPWLSVQVTGTLNWRTHALLRPTSLVVRPRVRNSASRCPSPAIRIARASRKETDRPGV